MTKTYNTPKRTHIVKTRLDDEEHADFLHQVEIYGMNQSEFIREAIPCETQHIGKLIITIPSFPSGKVPSWHFAAIQTERTIYGRTKESN